MASTSPQIYSPCQCARCQNAARVQSPAKVGNFPGQFTFMYVPIIRIWSNWVAVGYSLRLKYFSLQVGHKARQSTNSIRSDELKYWVGAEPLEDIEGDY